MEEIVMLAMLYINFEKSEIWKTDGQELRLHQAKMHIFSSVLSSLPPPLAPHPSLLLSPFLSSSLPMYPFSFFF